MNEVGSIPQQTNKYFDGRRRGFLTVLHLLSQGKNAGKLQEQTSHILIRYCQKTKQLAYTQQFRRPQPKRCNNSQFIYFCTSLCVLQMVFPSVIRSLKLHIQRQVFVRSLLLALRLAAGDSIGLTNT